MVGGCQRPCRLSCGYIGVACGLLSAVYPVSSRTESIRWANSTSGLRLSRQENMLSWRVVQACMRKFPSQKLRAAAACQVTPQDFFQR